MTEIQPAALNAAACELCPRRCRARRLDGARGYCAGGHIPRIYRYGPHFGEEPPLVGTRGSGTIFFSRCTLRCLYCQNYPWSQEGAGQDCSVERLAEILLELQAAGCHNWNLVSPTPWLPQIVEALDLAKAGGGNLPVVYNTSSYERVDILRTLGDRVAVYLADLRYADESTAQAASDASDYVRLARRALREMWRQVGPLRLDEHGVAMTGLICRVLVLPGRAHEACASLEWIMENLGPETAVSVMGQYVPAYRAAHCVGWDRRVTPAEYETVCRRMEDLGFINGWQQECGQDASAELLGYNMPPATAV